MGQYFVAAIPVSDWNDAEVKSNGRELEIEIFDTKEELMKFLSWNRDGRICRLFYGEELKLEDFSA
jgi:hypothetical protein